VCVCVCVYICKCVYMCVCMYMCGMCVYAYLVFKLPVDNI